MGNDYDVFDSSHDPSALVPRYSFHNWCMWIPDFGRTPNARGRAAAGISD